MIILLIIKILLSYYLIIKTKWIKDNDSVNICLDLFILFIFALLSYMNNINIMDTYRILKLGLVFLIIFFLFKIICFFLEKEREVIRWIEKKERMKTWLLKPKVNKIIYYFIWFLPWNLPYWVYFWIIENGVIFKSMNSK